MRPARQAGGEGGTVKFYRNHLTFSDGQSRGFEWFATKAEAEKAWDDIAPPPEDPTHRAEEFVVMNSKSSILELLAKVSTHADNG